MTYSQVFTIEIGKLRAYFTHRIQNMTELEIKETKNKTITILTSSLKTIFLSEGKTPKIYSDELLLLFYYKLITSKSLERRIKGIVYLTKFIEAIEKKENPGMRYLGYI